MVSEDQPDRLTELKSRLKSFSPGEETSTPQERLVHIQEDLVLVASWGNSPEVKQIDTELRDLFRQLTFLQPLLPKITQKTNNPVPSKTSNFHKSSDKWTSIKVNLQAFFFSFMAFIAMFILIISFHIPLSIEVSFILLGFAMWFSLWIFYKIAAPGVRLWFVKAPQVAAVTAGRWLGGFGGAGFGAGAFLVALGMGAILPENVGMPLILLSWVVIPILSILIGKSISNQPLGRDK